MPTGALTKAANDPDLRVTRDKVPEQVKSTVKEVAPAEVKQIAPRTQKQVEATEVNATNAEPWYQSRMVLGAIVSFSALTAGILGVQLDAEAQAEIVGAAGALFAL